ncbi:MAG: hypothetical protein ACR2JK_10030 [Geodermatophilaceae bacterium]
MTRDALEEGPPDPITGLPTYPMLDMSRQPVGVRPRTDHQGRTVRDVAGNPMLLNVEATTPDGRPVSEAAGDQEGAP